MNQMGRHVLADIYLEAWPGDDAVLAACERAIDVSRMNVVAQVVKRFRPSGVTGVWILSESHFSVHTYPEHGYLSVDCYTCGEEGRPDLAVRELMLGFTVRAANVNELPRGIDSGGGCVVGAVIRRRSGRSAPPSRRRSVRLGLSPSAGKRPG